MTHWSFLEVSKLLFPLLRTISLCFHPLGDPLQEMIEQSEGTHHHSLNLCRDALDPPEDLPQIHHNEEHVVEHHDEHDADDDVEPLEEGEPFDHRTEAYQEHSPTAISCTRWHPAVTNGILLQEQLVFRGRRIMAITSGFQPEDTGSIPVARSTKQRAEALRGLSLRSFGSRFMARLSAECPVVTEGVLLGLLLGQF